MSDRLSYLQLLVKELGVDALWLTFLPDIRWSCGFTGSNALLVVRSDAVHLITDGRYRTQAQQEVDGVDVHVAADGLIGHAAEAGLLRGCRNAVYQSDHLTVARRNEMKDKFPAVHWVGEEEILVRKVASKEEWEIDRIRTAQRLTESVFDEVLQFLRPGATEKDVAVEITYRHLRAGADGMAFEPIVASGPNAALPHGRPSTRKLQAGELVLLDFGCYLDGYASDMTRTVALGEPDAEARDVYDLVLAAQSRAIDAARAALESRELDDLARSVIREGGYGEFFTHGLGHGIGLQVHEWPRVSHTVDYSLPKNCVVTIEPGVYVPDRFGIRIEDIIVLRPDGVENLTSSRKDLMVV